jgi:hypothetical protein
MATYSLGGPICGLTRPQNINDGTTCRSISPCPGPVGGEGLAANVSAWPARQKLVEAARRAAPYLPKEAREQFLVLFSPKMLALTSATLAAWGIGQFLGYGEVVDLALLGWGVYALGSGVFAAKNELAAYLKGAVSAINSADLDTAGMHLARLVSLVGVTVLVAVVLKFGSKLTGRAIATAGLEADAEVWLIKLGRTGEPPMVRGRIGTAARFLLRNKSEGEVLDHLKAIDFSREVKEVTISKNDILVQRYNGRVGEYFARTGTPGENLGISMAGRIFKRYRLKPGFQSIRALESNTTPVVDTWTKGRALQVQIGSKGVFAGEDVTIIRGGEYTGGGGRQLMVLDAYKYFDEVK